MFRKSCRHSWGTLHPAIASSADREFETQAVMIIAEVILTAGDEHASHQGLGLLGKMAGAASQAGETLPEGGIETFDISRVDLATILA